MKRQSIKREGIVMSPRTLKIESLMSVNVVYVRVIEKNVWGRQFDMLALSQTKLKGKDE